MLLSVIQSVTGGLPPPNVLNAQTSHHIIDDHRHAMQSSSLPTSYAIQGCTGYILDSTTKKAEHQSYVLPFCIRCLLHVGGNLCHDHIMLTLPSAASHMDNMHLA
jgi:hypothetical protein